MQDDTGKTPVPPPAGRAKTKTEQRADALRDNLLKRKAQMRERKINNDKKD